ncbi:MAG: sensor histidine kinase [Flavobacteriales bacterium]
MGYNRFRLRIIWRIFILLSIWTAATYSVFQAGWIFLSILLIVISLAVIVEMIFFISRIHRDMDQCLQSILANDFSIYFPDKVHSGNDVIRSTANAIVARFKALQVDNERLLRLTDLVMENLPVAVICYEGDKNCCIYNSAAQRAIGMKMAPSMDRLKSLHEGLFPDEAHGNQKRVIKLQIGSVVNQYAVRNVTFKLAGIDYHLVTMENISSELDQMETESWRDLMRVLNHEIVNSITPIVSLSASLAEELTSEKPILSNDERIEAALAISSRSEGLLKFARGYRLFTTQKEPQKELMLVGDQLKAVKRLFAAEKELQISINPFQTDCSILCDPSHLGQILVNLLMNAFEAYDNTHAAEVSLGYTVVKDDCEIVIEDHGRGMDDETLSKVFIPYFTTREAGQGLGLSLCKQLVTLNGGKILVRSRPGQGTRVSLLFKIQKPEDFS